MSTVTVERASRSRLRRGKRSTSRRAGISPLRGLLPLVALLAAWQFFGSEQALTFPPPSLWFEAIGELWRDGELAPALVLTLKTFAIALLIAAVVGVALGAMVGASRRVDRALTPLMDFFRTLPPPAIVPAMALIIGPTVTSGILIVVLAAVWPILLNTAAGMRAVPPVRIEMARSLGLTRGERILKVVLPSLTPTVLVGLRVSVPIALVVTLFVETLGVTEGVGLLMRESQQTFDSAAVWGLLLIVGLGGYVINLLVTAGGARLQRNWPPSAGR